MRANRKFSNGGEIPISMIRAFSQNPASSAAFSSLNAQQQQTFIDRSFSSLACLNMSAYVDCCEDYANNISCFENMMLY